MQKPFYFQIEDAKSALEDMKKAYLRRFGWTCTSSMPGSYWLWRRDFADVDAQRMASHEKHKFPSKPQPYGVITADTELAIAMTRATLDEQNTPEEIAELAED
jgi:hypothetical protein